MQHALISRSLLEKVKRDGKFFHSPYPDIYAMSALLLEADRVLIYPYEIVVIGISSKSHGCFAINRREKEAVDLLNIKNEMSKIPTLRSILLPGFIVFTYWLGAIELFKLHFSLEKLKLELDYKIYRNLQVNHVLHFYFSNKLEFKEQFNALLKGLTLSEKILIIFPRIVRHSLSKALNHYENKFPYFIKAFKRFLKLFRSPPSTPTTYTPLNPPPGHLLPNVEPNRFSTILEIYEQVEPIDCSRC